MIPAPVSKEERALSFGNIAADYDRYRPSVPSDAIDWVLSERGTIVDLGAGTGLLTRALRGQVNRIIAVEPDPRMGRVFAQRYPEIELLVGTAEAIPLPAKSADGILVSMAWHWVDQERAVPEIARVLRPGGIFGVIWNHRDVSVPWVAKLDRFARAKRAEMSGGDGLPRPSRNDVSDPESGDHFGTLEEKNYAWQMTVTAEELIRHLATDASAIAMSAEGRLAVDQLLLAYLRDVVGLAGDTKLELPMTCRCLRLRKNLEVDIVGVSSNAR